MWWKVDETRFSSGFTLVEVLIALVVFAIGVLALSRLQLISIRGNREAFRLTDVSIIASSELESILGANYTSTALSPGIHTVSSGNYTIVYSVNETIPNRLKRVDLNVTRVGFVVRRYSYSVVIPNI